MWHRFALTLLLIVAGAAVVACGGGEPDTTPETAPEGSADVAPAADPPPDAPAENTDLTAEAREALGHEDRNRRLDSAWKLGQRDDIPGPAKAELLLEAIENEIRQPTPGPADGSYLDASEMARYVYTLALGRVATQVPDAVREVASGGRSELRDRAVLALGYAGHREVIPELREILRTSAIGDIRAEAARLMGDLEAREAIPDLREALLDPHQVVVESMMGGGSTELFPVRNSAAKALRKLGFRVELTPEQEYRIIDP